MLAWIFVELFLESQEEGVQHELVQTLSRWYFEEAKERAPAARGGLVLSSARTSPNHLRLSCFARRQAQKGVWMKTGIRRSMTVPAASCCERSSLKQLS